MKQQRLWIVFLTFFSLYCEGLFAGKKNRKDESAFLQENSPSILCSEIASTLQLPRLDPFAKATVLEEGMLTISSPSGLGADALVLSGGTLKTTTSFQLDKQIILATTGTIDSAEETILSVKGLINGAGFLTKSGKGGLRLQNENTYSGGTKVAEGTLYISSPSQVGLGALHLAGGDLYTEKTLSFENPLFIDSLGNIINAADTICTLQGALKGQGSISKQGKGSLRLTGNNTYSGETCIEEGSIIAKSDSNFGSSTIVFEDGSIEVEQSFTLQRPIKVKRSGSFIVPDQLSLTLTSSVEGEGHFVKKGKGTLSLTTDHLYRGNFFLEEGAVCIKEGGSICGDTLVFCGGHLEIEKNYTGVKPIIFTQSGALNIKDKASFVLKAPTYGSSSFKKSGKGTLILAGENHSTGSIIVEEGNLSFAEQKHLGKSPIYFPEKSSGTLLSRQDASLTNSLLVEGKATINTPQASQLFLEGSIKGQGSITKQGKGDLLLAGENTYEGSTTIVEGSLAIHSQKNLGKGPVFFPTFSTGTLTALSDLQLEKTVIVDAYATFITPGTVQMDLLNKVEGKGHLMKKGTGLLCIQNGHTYEGNTFIKEGILEIAPNASVGKGKIVIDGGSLKASHTLEKKPIFMKTSGAILVPENHFLLIDGTIEGMGSVHKKELGELILSGENVYAGGTYIEEGSLVVKRSTALGKGALHLAGGTCTLHDACTVHNPLQLESAGAISVHKDHTAYWAGPISGEFPMTKTGPGTLFVEGENTYEGITFIKEGALCIRSETCLGNSGIKIAKGELRTLENTLISSPISITENSVFHPKKGTTLTLSGPLSGTGSVSKEGQGKLKITGDAPFTGSFTLNGGVLELGKGRCLGRGSFIIEKGSLHVKDHFTTDQPLQLEQDTTILDIDASASFSSTGTIQGEGSLVKKGKGKAYLQGENTYSLGTQIKEGSLHIHKASNLGTGGVFFEGGSLTILSSISSDQEFTVSSSQGEICVEKNASFQVDGALKGEGILSKKGPGTLTLSSNCELNATLAIDEGSLVLQNSDQKNASLLNALIKVEKGAFLAGNGFMGDTILEGGRVYGEGTYANLSLHAGCVAPGNSIGTIVITGNYAQSAGSVYELEIDGSLSDRIIASGTATIETGAVLEILPPKGTIIKGETYNILEASEGINQLWSEIVNSANIPFSLTRTNGNTVAELTLLESIYFIGTDFASGSASSLRRYLNEFELPGSSPLLPAILSASSLSDSDLNQALSNWTPALFGAIDVAHLSLVKRAFPTDFSLKDNQRNHHLWAQPTYSYASYNPIHDLPGFSESALQLQIGYNRIFMPQMLAGGSIGYSYSDTNWKSSSSSANSQYFYTTLYGLIDYPLCAFDLGLFTSWQIYDQTRKVEYSDISETCKSVHNGASIAAHLCGKYFILKDELLSLFANVEYSALFQESYQEKGSNAFSLFIDPNTSHLLAADIGLKSAYLINTQRASTNISLKAAWSVQTPLNKIQIPAKFSSIASDAFFSVNGLNKTLSAFTPEISVDFSKDPFSLTFYIGGAFSPDYVKRDASARFTYIF